MDASDGPTPLPWRPVRSFVRREGRLTGGQQRALDELLPRYGVPQSDWPLDPARLFGRSAPLVLDIGFGDGEALAELALRHPERDFLGIEVYRSGVGRLLRQLHDQEIGNVRVACEDGVVLLAEGVADGALAGLHLFFPDPWPKKRHHKRRMVQPDWLALVARKLQPGGYLHLATDWADYAAHMLAIGEGCPDLRNRDGRGRFAADRAGRPETKFERRGRRKGHGVWDLVLERPLDAGRSHPE